jgi:hypothetical protein
MIRSGDANGARLSQVSEPSSAEPKGQILRFRPRGSLLTRNLPQPSPVEDLGKYERANDDDDYRHRMMVNGAALGFIIFLIVAGVWIADTMAQMRQNQDCVLSGRRGCTPVIAPVTPRY